MIDETELEAQIRFLREADRLKGIVRASPLIDGSRRENSAEHSWHLALYALVLGGCADPQVNIDRVIRMLLLHDIVEIDAGDAPIHGAVDPKRQEELEAAAADRIFGLLPGPQAAEFRALWREFEEGASPDARFAKSLDRFQPLVQNVAAGGGTWRDGNVSREQVHVRYGPQIEAGSRTLWDHAKRLVARHFG
ncbi:HD domain-containing protein [Stappia sp.]|uniref:HD domain-containing protein n=1 Tax=Stappia sp. TaxID=1870903 RepID=UPI003A9A559D